MRYTAKQKSRNPCLIRQNISGKHGQPIDDDLYIYQLQKKIPSARLAFCPGHCPRKAESCARSARQEIKDISCAQIFHNRLDPWNDFSKSTAEQSGKTHQSERSAPDSGHKADITGNAVFAGCGQKEKSRMLIGTRRPDGKDGRQGHFYEDR